MRGVVQGGAGRGEEVDLLHAGEGLGRGDFRVWHCEDAPDGAGLAAARAEFAAGQAVGGGDGDGDGVVAGEVWVVDAEDGGAGVWRGGGVGEDLVVVPEFAGAGVGGGGVAGVLDVDEADGHEAFVAEAGGDDGDFGGGEGGGALALVGGVWGGVREVHPLPEPEDHEEVAAEGVHLACVEELVEGGVLEGRGGGVGAREVCPEEVGGGGGHPAAETEAVWEFGVGESGAEDGGDGGVFVSERGGERDAPEAVGEPKAVSGGEEGPGLHGGGSGGGRWGWGAGCRLGLTRDCEKEERDERAEHGGSVPRIDRLPGMPETEAKPGALRLLGRAAVNSLCALHPALVERRVAEAVARSVPGEMKRLLVPGFQYALVVGERAVVGGAVGVARAGEAMTQRSRFRVASLSKPVSALVLLQAAASGEFDADAPVEPYVPEWDWGGAKRPVTVRRLLRHEAGLASLHAAHAADGEEAVLAMRGVPGVGGKSGYSGLNYVAAQLAVERMTRGRFEEMAARHVFGPLGLSGAGFGAASRAGTVGFHDEEGRELGRMWSPALASSGLVASAAEIATVVREALCALGGRRGVFSPEVARDVLVPREGALFACGFSADERAGVVTHGGQRPGYRGFLFVDLRVRALCVLLANGERGGDVNREVSGLAADLAGRLRA